MVEVVRLDRALILDGIVKPGVYKIGIESSDPVLGCLKNLGGGEWSSGEHVFLSPDLESIADEGDVVTIGPGARSVRSLLARRTEHNTILVTEACENLCIFCSQPPKDSWHFFKEAAVALRNFDLECQVGITGGEPTLYWDAFIEFCSDFVANNESKSLHILSHGRNLSSEARVAELQSTGIFQKSVWGIPVHGSNSDVHDAITGRKDSFEQTIDGALNIGFAGATIEFRIIVCQQNYQDIPNILEFINSYFVGIDKLVAIMQLEPMGYAKNRYEELFVAPNVLESILTVAGTYAKAHQLQIQLYNFPLCHLDESVRALAVQSISDWKNYFPNECSACKLKPNCCGFFASAKGSRIEMPRPEQ